MWKQILFTGLGVHIFLIQVLVFAQDGINPVPFKITKNETEEKLPTEKPGPVLTGDPQKDYIHDPNLPRELDGYDLSDYPFYRRLPEDMHNFTCDGRHDGFYASIPHKCQVYHNCLFGIRYDFMCANFTAFDQSNFICHYANAVDCKHSEMYYHRNEELYIDPTTPPPPPKPKVKIVYRDRPQSTGKRSKKKESKQSKPDPALDYYYYYEDDTTPKTKKDESYYYYDEDTTASTTTTTTVKPISIRKRFPNLTRQRTRQGLEQIPRAHGLGGEPNQAIGRQRVRRPIRRRHGGKRPRKRKTTTTTTTTQAPEYYDYYDDDDYYYYYDDEVSSSSTTTTTTTTTVKPPKRQRRPGKRRRRPRPSKQNREKKRRILSNEQIEQPQEETQSGTHPGPRGAQPFKIDIEDPSVYEDIPNDPPPQLTETINEEIVQEQTHPQIRRPTLARRAGSFRRRVNVKPAS